MAASLTKVTARVLWIIGARGSAFDTTVSDDRFILEEVQRAAIETEGEIVRVLCESRHPMRAPYLAFSSAILNGGQVPEHIGPIEGVRITPYVAFDDGDAGDNAIEGEYTSRENIRLWRQNYSKIFCEFDHDEQPDPLDNASYSALAGYYNITNNTLVYTGTSAVVNICTYVPNAAAFSIHEMFEDLLVAGTVIRLNKLGVPQALISTYGQLYSGSLGLLKQGATEMPDLPVAQISG